MTMGRTCGAGAASLGRVAKIAKLEVAVVMRLLPRNRTGAISRNYR
jgi:hypothetical protein